MVERLYREHPDFSKSTNLKTRVLQTGGTTSAERMTEARIPEFSYQIPHEVSYVHGKIFLRFETIQTNKEPVYNINISILCFPQISSFNLHTAQSLST